MLHKQATICCNNKSAWQWICCACQYGWPGTRHTHCFMELIWEHGRFLGMLPDIAALYGQNSCSGVLLFRDRDEGIKRVPAARLFQSPLGLWFQPFPDLSFEFYFAHHCQVFKPSPCPSPRWTCESPIVSSSPSWRQEARFLSNSFLCEFQRCLCYLFWSPHLSWTTCVDHDPL